MDQVQQLATDNPTQQYEPPHIERVITIEDLAREVQYAGVITLPG
jgi:hypothetical protein